MPKHLSLDSLTLDTRDGSIAMTFGLEIKEGKETIHTSPLRRIIGPDGDVDQNLDDIDAYAKMQGYSPVTSNMRRLVHAIDSICSDDKEISANREAAAEKIIAERKAMEASMQPAEAPAEGA